MSAYAWLAFAHVVSAFLFALSHGPAIFVVFKIRGERDPVRIRSLLELSALSVGVLHMTTLLLIGTGVALAFMADLWAQTWIWASLGLILVLWTLMHWLGSRHYDRVRAAVGARPFYLKKGVPQPPAAPPEELARLLANRRPEWIAVLGGAALVAFLYLMRFRPM